jgi:hypothetical protein
MFEGVPNWLSRVGPEVCQNHEVFPEKVANHCLDPDLTSSDILGEKKVFIDCPYCRVSIFTPIEVSVLIHLLINEF